MSLLLTAGTGKTSIRAASLLNSADSKSSFNGTPFLLTSRRDPSSVPNLPSNLRDHVVKFDFLDSSTYSNPWSKANDHITAIYLVAPETQDPSPSMIDLVNFAVDKGVKRFVMLTGLTAKKGGPHVGGVWAHLDSLKAGKGVRYAVLRCTWFMENFSEREHLKSITEKNSIYTCTGSTKIPFISAADIARVALTLMTVDDDRFDSLIASTNNPSGSTGDCDIQIFGGESLDHDEAASILSATLSRTITHDSLSPSEMETYYTNTLSMPAPRAKFMAWLQSSTGDVPTSSLPDVSEVERVTGVKPIGFQEWVEENRGAWSAA